MWAWWVNPEARNGKEPGRFIRGEREREREKERGSVDKD